MVTVVDLGICNLRSVQKALKRIAVESTVASSSEEVRRAQKLILPGIGHFRMGMQRIDALGLREALDEAVLRAGVPILGICLGMQLLTRHSEEGAADGLGWIDATTVRFEANGLKVPHMGWNQARPAKEGPLFDGIDPDDAFYFVHSYHVQCDHTKDVLGETLYGRSFASAVQKDRIFGVQFHPEKSHDAGLRLLKNFVQS